MKIEKNRILIFILVLTFVKWTTAQDVGFKKVDSLSVKYYYSAQWDSLLRLAKEAKRNHIDYYYLNYRVGVAYFLKSDYMMAAYFLGNAYSQNKSALFDPYFKSIYFKSLLYTKQNITANSLLVYGDSLDRLVGIKYRGSVYFDALYGKAIPLIPQSQLRLSKKNIFSQTDYQQAISMFSGGATAIISRKMQLWVDYGYADLAMVGAIENERVFDTRNYKVNQKVVNIKSQYQWNRKSSLSPALGLSFVNGNPFGIVDTATDDLGFYPYAKTSFMLGLDYQHRYKNIRWGVSGAVSNFGDKSRQLQVGASFIWFPKGNLDLYSHTQVFMTRDVTPQFRPILYQQLGIKLVKNTWLEGEVIYGDVKNFTLLSNNYSFEIANHIYGMASTKIIYVLNSYFNLFVAGQYWWKYADKLEYDTSGKEYKQTINYNQFNILGGIQWKF